MAQDRHERQYDACPCGNRKTKTSKTCRECSGGPRVDPDRTKFGMLTISGDPWMTTSGYTYHCICDCGKTRNVPKRILYAGDTVACVECTRANAALPRAHRPKVVQAIKTLTPEQEVLYDALLRRPLGDGTEMRDVKRDAFLIASAAVDVKSELELFFPYGIPRSIRIDSDEAAV